MSVSGREREGVSVRERITVSTGNVASDFFLSVCLAVFVSLFLFLFLSVAVSFTVDLFFSLPPSLSLILSLSLAHRERAQ